MKAVPFDHFIQIEAALREDTASSYNWAEARIREILDHLKTGNQLTIQENHGETLISSLEELIAWKRTKNLPRMNLGVSIDNPALIKKLNINVERYQVCKLEASESPNQFSGKQNLNFGLYASNGQSFYAGFKDVLFHQFTEPLLTDIEQLVFRAAAPNEIEALNKNLAVTGQVLVAVELKLKHQDKNTRYIVCRELEN